MAALPAADPIGAAATGGGNPFAADPRRPDWDAIVAANAETLRLIERGLSEIYVEPRSATTAYALGTWHHEQRELARLLVIEARWHASHGRWSEAVNSACDAIALGGQTAHGGGFIGMMAGYAMFGVGTEILREMLPYLSRSALDEELNRLPKALNRRVDMSEVLDAEFADARAQAAESMADPGWEEGKDWLLDEGYTREQVDAVTEAHFSQALTDYGNRLVAIVDQPFGTVPLPGRADDSLADISTSNLPSAWAINTQHLAEQRLLLTTVALQSYRVGHGEWPAALTELVPDYLPALPNDPFSNSSLVYRRTVDGYLLYSLGPNRQDDGGAKFEFPDDPSDAANFLTAPGDIVE